MTTAHTGRLQRAKVIRPRAEVEQQLIPRCSEVPRPTAPFTLMHAHQWSFAEDYEGGRWLPEITEIRHEIGCNGVDGRGDPAAALTGHQRKRSIVIHNGDPRLPADLRHYLASYDMKGGGKFYCFPSVTFAWLQGGRAVKAVVDRTWEYRFRQALIDERIVPAMSPDVLATHVAVLEDRISRKRRAMDAGQLQHDAGVAQIAELRATIERYTEAYAEQFGDEHLEPVDDDAADAQPVTRGPRLELDTAAPPVDEHVVEHAAARPAAPPARTRRISTPAQPPADGGDRE